MAKTTRDILRDYTDLLAAVRMSAELVKLKLEPDNPAIDGEDPRASGEAEELTRELRSLVCEVRGSSALTRFRRQGCGDKAGGSHLQ